MTFPFEPIRVSDRDLSARTYADVQVLFILPKSALHVSLRVRDGITWMNVPIDLKLANVNSLRRQAVLLFFEHEPAVWLIIFWLLE
jgi:hypothetical protein